MKQKFTLIALSFIAAVSCIQEIRHEMRETSDKEIAFKATEYEAYLTRSGSDDDASALESRRMFLGMAGKDSIFITASASDIPAFKAPTKAGEGQSGGTVPESFHIVAFKDEAGTPYTDLKVTSPDGWESYSPMMYWPNEKTITKDISDEEDRQFIFAGSRKGADALPLNFEDVVVNVAGN